MLEERCLPPGDLNLQWSRTSKLLRHVTHDSRRYEPQVPEESSELAKQAELDRIAEAIPRSKPTLQLRQI